MRNYKDHRIEHKSFTDLQNYSQNNQDYSQTYGLDDVNSSAKSKSFSLRSYRFLLLFAFLIVISAQLLIMTTQLARNKQFQLQELEKQTQELEIERGRLLLERGALTSPARIEKIAREKLNMHFPKTNEIKVLTEQK